MLVTPRDTLGEGNVDVEKYESITSSILRHSLRFRVWVFTQPVTNDCKPITFGSFGHEFPIGGKRKRK